MLHEWLRTTLNEEITLDCKRDPATSASTKDVDGECRHKIAALVSMHHAGDIAKRERTAEVASRVGAPDLAGVGCGCGRGVCRTALTEWATQDRLP